MPLRVRFVGARREDLLNPDLVYPVYGDSSLEVQDANARFPLYFELKADTSSLRVGNVRPTLAGGDLGFANAQTYDLEVWAPGVGRWLEVSSCSLYNDYQARRANIRFRSAPGAKPEFVHTLNGSAMGMPRTLIALLETYQQADGSIHLPDAVAEYLGTDRITA